MTSGVSRVNHCTARARQGPGTRTSRFRRARPEAFVMIGGMTTRLPPHDLDHDSFVTSSCCDGILER
jgi:hypothetical protein